jgi:hypothetical protein
MVFGDSPGRENMAKRGVDVGFDLAVDFKKTRQAENDRFLCF